MTGAMVKIRCGTKFENFQQLALKLDGIQVFLEGHTLGFQVPGSIFGIGPAYGKFRINKDTQADLDEIARKLGLA